MKFPSFQSRSQKLERIDRGEFTDAEYKLWKEEMKLIHSLFGEKRAIRRSLIAEVEKSPAEQVSILDVGAGTGDLTLGLKQAFDSKKIFIVGVDVSSDSAAALKANDINSVRCDALTLPFADESFDYVFCTLFLHHLDEHAAIRLIGQMKRVAKERIFVIDLDRNPVAYYLYRLFGHLFLQPFTRDDGALSILRAYTEPELRRMAESAGLQNVTIQRSQINRLILSGSS